MPLSYLDTSGLVKRYLPEAGSAWVTHLCHQEPITTSLIAVPEMASAFARRAREGALTSQQRDALFRAFLRDARAFALVAPNRTVVQWAARLLFQAPPHIRLRALDAVHLASALLAFARARRRGVATGDFVSADLDLLAAAQWAGLSTRNPETQT
jgi:predicted nucleic acid-binding protein